MDDSLRTLKLNYFHEYIYIGVQQYWSNFLRKYKGEKNDCTTINIIVQDINILHALHHRKVLCHCGRELFPSYDMP